MSLTSVLWPLCCAQTLKMTATSHTMRTLLQKLGTQSNPLSLGSGRHMNPWDEPRWTVSRIKGFIFPTIIFDSFCFVSFLPWHGVEGSTYHIWPTFDTILELSQIEGSLMSWNCSASQQFELIHQSSGCNYSRMIAKSIRVHLSAC